MSPDTPSAPADLPSASNLDITDLIAKAKRVPFNGLDDKADQSYPDPINLDSPAHDDDPVTFRDIIELLPQAKEGALLAVNEYVNEDGTVATDQIRAETDLNLDELPIDLTAIDDADQHVGVDEYKDIVDPRRKALAALGFDVNFRWQVATPIYAIINPSQAYNPAYRTLMNQGKRDDVFGWLDFSDWGGDVDLYLLFENNTIERPNADEDDDPIYVGFHTGYDFTGNRKLSLSLFGYDPAHDTRMYSLGETRSRKHAGNPNDDQHEAANGRVPISEWWDNQYENLLVWTEDLAQDIVTATNLSLDFSELEYGVADFYRYLDIPQSYIYETDNGVGAVNRVHNHSTSGSTVSMWVMYFALAATLEAEFKGEHTSTQFMVYSGVAEEILRSPRKIIKQVAREHEYQKEDTQTATEKHLTQDTMPGVEDIDNIAQLDGITKAEKMNIRTRRSVTKQVQETLESF